MFTEVRVFDSREDACGAVTALDIVGIARGDIAVLDLHAIGSEQGCGYEPTETVYAARAISTAPDYERSETLFAKSEGTPPPDRLDALTAVLTQAGITASDARGIARSAPSGAAVLLVRVEDSQRRLVTATLDGA